MSGLKKRTLAFERHFTVAVFVVHDDKVLLLRHPELGIWLPPGGHIEPNESPDSAACREVKEETGLDVRLIGYRGSDAGVTPQTSPLGIQIERISPGHEHIDLIYAAKPEDSSTLCLVAEHGITGLGWYDTDEARKMGVREEVLGWMRNAMRAACGDTENYPY